LKKETERKKFLTREETSFETSNDRVGFYPGQQSGNVDEVYRTAAPGKCSE
jgi:hypothetical protein